MGVCSNADWPFTANKPGQLTAYRAEEARRVTIGAYYRVSLSIADFHAALNETGAIYVSAMIHKGWAMNQITKGKINWRNTYSPTGGHAFAIVGYDATGFYVQNSVAKIGVIKVWPIGPMRIGRTTLEMRGFFSWLYPHRKFSPALREKPFLLECPFSVRHVVMKLWVTLFI